MPGKFYKKLAKKFYEELERIILLMVNVINSNNRGKKRAEPLNFYFGCSFIKKNDL